MKKSLYKKEGLVKAVELTLLLFQKQKTSVENFIKNYTDIIVDLLNPYEVEAILEKEKEEKKPFVSWNDGYSERYLTTYAFTSIQLDICDILVDRKEISGKEIKNHEKIKRHNLKSGSGLGASFAGLTKKSRIYNLPVIYKVEKRKDDEYYSMISSAKDFYRKFRNLDEIETPKKRGRPFKTTPECTESLKMGPETSSTTHILKKSDGTVIRRDGSDQKTI